MLVKRSGALRVVAECIDLLAPYATITAIDGSAGVTEAEVTCSGHAQLIVHECVAMPAPGAGRAVLQKHGAVSRALHLQRQWRTGHGYTKASAGKACVLLEDVRTGEGREIVSRPSLEQDLCIGTDAPGAIHAGAFDRRNENAEYAFLENVDGKPIALG